MNFSGFEDPWLMVGDFNSVLGAHETSDDISSLPCDEFQSMITVCDLVEIETRGIFYTWICRRRNCIVLSRLDRTFCSPSFLDVWSWVSCAILPRLR